MWTFGWLVLPFTNFRVKDDFAYAICYCVVFVAERMGFALDRRPSGSILVEEGYHRCVDNTQLGQNKYFFGFLVESKNHVPRPKELVAVGGGQVLVCQTQCPLDLVEPIARHVISEVRRIPEFVFFFVVNKSSTLYLA